MGESSDDIGMMKNLPRSTFAVMVHKLFQNRVQDFLSTSPKERLQLLHQNIKDAKPKKDTAVEVLDCPPVAGVSRSRRGYILLLLRDTVDESTVIQLSPLARQNISWMARISHCSRVPLAPRDIDNNKQQPLSLDRSRTVGDTLWKSLTGTHGYVVDKDVLRVGVHPRTEMEFVCRSLQRAAIRQQEPVHSAGATPVTIDPNDEYDGPIDLTPSRTKCTFRITVVFQPMDDPNSNTAITTTRSTDSSTPPQPHQFQNIFWGVDSRPPHNALIDLRLNHEATEEIPVIPSDNSTGQDLKHGRKRTVNSHSDTVTPAAMVTTPLSRAYYKLEQVYKDYLQQFPPQDRHWQNCMGLDLGASPGGWTQVLVHLLGLSKVVSVDAAALADRVTRLPQVTHIRSKMQELESSSCPKGPYSIIVCDACVLWMELFVLLKEKVLPCIQCCLPSTWVMTMKLPFRSTGSIRRHIQSLQEQLDTTLDEMARILFPQQEEKEQSRVRCTWQLVHLMANSDSERTLLVHFQQATATNTSSTQAGK